VQGSEHGVSPMQVTPVSSVSMEQHRQTPQSCGLSSICEQCSEIKGVEDVTHVTAVICRCSSPTGAHPPGMRQCPLALHCLGSERLNGWMGWHMDICEIHKSYPHDLPLGSNASLESCGFAKRYKQATSVSSMTSIALTKREDTG
jgi:hypothetical protein